MRIISWKHKSTTPLGTLIVITNPQGELKAYFYLCQIVPDNYKCPFLSEAIKKKIKLSESWKKQNSLK